MVYGLPCGASDFTERYDYLMSDCDHIILLRVKKKILKAKGVDANYGARKLKGANWQKTFPLVCALADSSNSKLDGGATEFFKSQSSSPIRKEDHILTIVSRHSSL